ncbi:MAG: hypothetical protein PHE70_09815 [Tepidanaerobacteraceae bacterium]|nr:hypothetical protein [Tepidanaerobacteraceae bacterium]
MDNEMLDLMTKMYAEMQKGFSKVDERFKQVDGRLEQVDERLNLTDGRLNNMEGEIKDIKTTVLKIEQEHGDKLSALFDGYKQNSDKLDRIEKEVSRHEEIILRRIG